MAQTLLLREHLTAKKDGHVASFPNGSKYALIALGDGMGPSDSERYGLELENGLVVTSHLPFELPKHWHDWLGEFRVKAIRDAGLFLSAVARSDSPEILDGENESLRKAVERFYLGFLVTAGPFHHREAFTATGGVHDNEVDVRRVTQLTAIYRTAGSPPRDWGSTAFRAAAKIAARMEEWAAAKTHDRVRRVFAAFYSGLRSQHITERLHQSVRVIEGVFKTGRGEGRKQFRRRFVALAGEGHDELADVLYEIRSAVEHLRDPYAPIVDEPKQELLGRYACIVESLARVTVQALYLNEQLAAFFKTEDTVDAFWSLSDSERRDVLGPPADLRALSRGFDKADWDAANED